MIQFRIQADSAIPASNQLYNQLLFAIASRQFPPGHHLPSTRQLAMLTGLHRNTISKVYRQLEDAGLVEARAGSGIYVRSGHQADNPLQSTVVDAFPQARGIVQNALDELLRQGCSLNQIRDLVLAELDWRVRCSAEVLITAPTHDIRAGEIILRELKKALTVPIQLVPLETLGAVLDEGRSGTVVTNQYFIAQAEAIAKPRAVRVFAIDIYDFSKEIQIIQKLPKGTCLGLSSLSSETLGVAEVIINSLRGDDLLVITAPAEDAYKLKAMVRSANTIICDSASLAMVKTALHAAREDIIRPPQLIWAESFVTKESIQMLKRELGLDP
jgi:GntR family transcriptional regulator